MGSAPQQIEAGVRRDRAFGRVGLYFEPNLGQAPASVAYLARSGGVEIALENNRALFRLRMGTSEPQTARTGIQLLHSNPDAVWSGLQPSSGKSNYFLGKQPSNWVTRIPHYQRVRLSKVYPGIDLEFYGSEKDFEYDFIIAPAADPRRITFRICGAASARIDEAGELRIQGADGTWRIRKPSAYTETEDKSRIPVTVSFRQAGESFGFEVGDYDRTSRLVIDPVLVYSTLLGGALSDFIQDIAVDSQGQAILVGKTSSIDFPILDGFLAEAPGGGCFKTTDGGRHWFPAKGAIGAGDVAALAFLEGTPNALFAAVGGVGIFRSTDLAESWTLVSPQSEAYLSVFALVPGPATSRTIYGLGTSGIVKTSDDGASWVSVNNGLPTGVQVNCLAVDPSNSSLLLAGLETGGIYKSTDGGQHWSASNSGNPNTGNTVRAIAFLSGAPYTVFAGTYGGLLKSDDRGGLWKSTTITNRVRWVVASPAAADTIYVGTIGTANYDLNQSIDGGNTWLSAYATQDMQQLLADPAKPGTVYSVSQLFGINRITCTRETSAGKTRLVLTPTGINNGLTSGIGNKVRSLVIDPDDSNRLFAGSQSEGNAFVAKLNSDGTDLIFSTFLGGLGADEITGVAVDDQGAIYVVGETGSSDFPVANPFQSSRLGSTDAFLAKLTSDGSELLFSTYLGGADDDKAFAVAVDSGHSIYLTGTTTSSNFPKLNSLAGSTFVKSRYAFVTKFQPSGQTLAYSTLLGGSVFAGWQEEGRNLIVDGSGRATVVGLTGSTNFPTVNAFQNSYGGGDTDGFVSRLAADGKSLVFSSCLGGSGNDQIDGVALDAGGRTWLTGRTQSTNFPLSKASQTTFGGDSDAFLAVVGTDSKKLERSTYLGGTNFDWGRDLGIDEHGAVWLAGYTNSANFPLVAPDLLADPAGADLLLLRFPDATSPADFSTLLGGTASENGGFLAIGVDGDIFLAGNTRWSTGDLPLFSWKEPAAFQFTPSGDDDGLIARFSPTASLVFPRYLSDKQGFTSFAVSNVFDHGVDLTFTARDSTGKLLSLPQNPAHVSLNPKEQFARYGSEIFQSGSASQNGWVEMETDSLVGAFMLSGGVSAPLNIDGATASSSATSELWLTRVFQGSKVLGTRDAVTTLHLANPGGTSSQVRIALHSNAGALLATEVTRTIPAGGVLTGSVTEIFGAGLKVAEGYVHAIVESGPGITGFEWISISSGTVVGINAAIGNPWTAAYSAQLGTGLGLFTSVKFLNTTSETRRVSMMPTGESGNNLVPTAWSTDLAPGACLEFKAADLFAFPADQLTVGSLRAWFSGPGVVGDVLFGSETFTYAAAMPLQYKGFYEAVFSQVANAAPFFTGIAAFNPTTYSDNDVTVEVYDVTGELVEKTDPPVRLGRFQRFSLLLPELLQATEGQIRGYVIIRSKRGVIAQQLFGDTGGNSLSAVPPTIFR